MKKPAIASLALLLVLSSAGCWGPQKLTRHMDDWTNQTYAEDPWLMGNLASTALLRAVFFVTGTLDLFINGYYFLLLDAEPLGGGTGTAFRHLPVTPARK